MICGNDGISANLLLYYGDTDEIVPIHVFSYQSTGLLIQPSGNLYYKHALPNKIIELDESRPYYLVLEAGPYNTSECSVNSGFGEYASWIQAKKIK